MLEFARRGYEELSFFAIWIRRSAWGSASLTSRTTKWKRPELIASRIERIVKTLGPERLRYVHPDCGFWMLQRSVADRKMRALVEGRDLFEGRL